MSKDLFWEDKTFNLINYLNDSIEMMDEEQKSRVQKILKRIEDGMTNGFSLCCEKILTGGKPKFSSEIYSFEQFAYSTTRNGDAYHYGIYFLAKDTGMKDRKNRPILETDDHVKFVIVRWAGSPEYFGGLEFKKPEF